jgi:RND family efflux transporter MFP subunit
MRRTFRPGVLIGACLLLTACGQAAEEKPPEPTALVKTALVTPAGVDDALQAYGRAEFDPAEGQTLTAPVDARLTATPVTVGQAVAAGTPVAILTVSATARLDIDKAVRDASVAQAEYQRLTRLRADGLAADNEVAAARAAAGSASETANSLKTRTGSGTIVLRATRSGVIDAMPAAVGDVVTSGSPVVRIGGLGRLRARLGVEPQDAGRIAAGQVVRLSPAAGEGASFVGQVQSVDRRVDPATRLAGVLVVLPGGAGFLPGQAVKGEIVLGHREGAPSVPRAALLYEGDASYVYVATGGKAVKRTVTLGVDTGEIVEITQGVRPGEKVVVEGGAALDDGMKLREGPIAVVKAAS